MAEQTRTKRRRGSWRRVPEARRVGGVAAGVSARTGVDVTVVRTVFVFLALAGGFGIACYLVAWLLVPAVGEQTGIGSAAMSDRTGITLAAGLASLLVAVFVLMSLVGAGWVGSLAWSVVISVISIVLISRNAPPASRRRFGAWLTRSSDSRATPGARASHCVRWSLACSSSQASPHCSWDTPAQRCSVRSPAWRW